MAIAEIRKAITASVGTITAINVSDVAPAAPNPGTFYLVYDNPPYNYQHTAGSGSYQVNLLGVLIASRANVDEAQIYLDTYALPTGASSVRAKILAADATAGTFAAIWCNDSEWGPMEINGTIFLTLRWKIKLEMYQ